MGLSAARFQKVYAQVSEGQHPKEQEEVRTGPQTESGRFIVYTLECHCKVTARRITRKQLRVFLLQRTSAGSGRLVIVAEGQGKYNTQNERIAGK